MSRRRVDVTRREVCDLAEACATAYEHLAWGYARGGVPTDDDLARAARFRQLAVALLGQIMPKGAARAAARAPRE